MELKVKNRVEYIDLAKGFCILLVIFTHAKGAFLVSSSLDFAMASFRMPLYFLLSGLFFKEYDGFFDFLLRKTNKLLIPFIFFYIVIALLSPLLLDRFVPGFIKNAGWNYIFCIYNENLNGMPMGIWFLWCLFLVNVLFYVVILIAKIRPNSFLLVLISLSLLLGILGFHLGYNKINLPLYLDTSLTAFPFFCCGYVFRKFTNLLYPNKYDKYLLIFSLICFVLVIMCAYDKVSFRKNEFDVSIFSVYICGILGALGVLFISKKIRKMPFVSFMGRYSIMVLCSHQVVLMGIGMLLKRLNCTGWSAVMISFMLTSVISYLLIHPMKKYLPYVTAQKDLL